MCKHATTVRPMHEFLVSAPGGDGSAPAKMPGVLPNPKSPPFLGSKGNTKGRKGQAAGDPSDGAFDENGQPGGDADAVVEPAEVKAGHTGASSHGAGTETAVERTAVEAVADGCEGSGAVGDADGARDLPSGAAAGTADAAGAADPWAAFWVPGKVLEQSATSPRPTRSVASASPRATRSTPR